MFITPSADAPKDASVLRTFQQLYVDDEDRRPMQSSSFAEESAFQELSNLYRRYLQSQQSVMMEETRPTFGIAV
ncbi:hypothetical protein GN244_ATG17076 [Phytophthora infestans]|nr:hypothetical protein GN244_ATG17076 [Phytophthora infestans]